jgi:hypothetical protein
MNQLSSLTRFESAVTPTAGVAGTSAINSTVIDTSNAEGVLFLVRMGTITAGAVTSIKVQQGDASNLSDAADLAGTNQTIADTQDDQIFVVDVKKPIKRYIRLVVSRATQNAVVASAEALVYGLRSLPFSQPAGTNVEAFGTPAAGTA